MVTDAHLSSRNRRTLGKIFQHPLCLSIHWRDVIHLFEGLGASVEQSKDKVKVALNGVEHFFPGPRHSKTVNSRDEVVDLRHFLEQAGFKP